MTGKNVDEWKPVPEKPYQPKAEVTFEGQLYRCWTIPTSGHQPPEDSSWWRYLHEIPTLTDNNGKRVELSRPGLRLLMALAPRPRTLVSNDELKFMVWGKVHNPRIHDAASDVMIALGRQCLENVRGYGYLLNLDVVPIVETGSAIADRTTSVVKTHPSVGRTKAEHTEEPLQPILGERLQPIATQFIGFSPEIMDHINDLVSRSHSRLRILADFIGYCNYSAPLHFDEYVRFMKDVHAKKNVTIEILTYANELAEAELRAQFEKDDFEEEKLSGRYRYFFGTRYPALGHVSDYESFIRVQVSEERSEAERVSHFAQIRLIQERSPFFFWSRDEREAVFCVQGLESPEEGLGFHTTDRKVVDALQHLFKERWKVATEFS
jgi:DNA-binding winged helix-turn-helix (wHTH) protein